MSGSHIQPIIVIYCGLQADVWPPRKSQCLTFILRSLPYMSHSQGPIKYFEFNFIFIYLFIQFEQEKFCSFTSFLLVNDENNADIYDVANHDKTDDDHAVTLYGNQTIGLGGFLSKKGEKEAR